VNKGMLKLEKVNVFRGPVHVLRDISLSVDEGEIVCLVGRNGAGKTTTLKSIMRLLPVKSGKIFFKDIDLLKIPSHKILKLGIGFSPEDSGIFPDLTVEDNIKMPLWTLKIQNRNTNTLDKVLEIFPEIKPLLSRQGLHLSGGERKMVSVARALITSPSLVLLDEPLEGLAPVVVGKFINAINRMKATGISVLITESNIQHVYKIKPTRTYIIERGEIVEEKKGF